MAKLSEIAMERERERQREREGEIRFLSNVYMYISLMFPTILQQPTKQFLGTYS